MKARLTFFLFLLIAPMFSLVLTASVPPIQVLQPQPSEVYYTGQHLVLIVKYLPNATATIYLITPNGKYVPEGVFYFNSSGYLKVDFGTFGSGNLAVPGNYILEIEVNSGESAITVPFTYQLLIDTIIVKVQNPQGMPIPDAYVTLYNASTYPPLPLISGQTNGSGIIVFSGPVPDTVQVFEVSASAPGYLNASKTFSLPPNQTAFITLTLQPEHLNIYVLGAKQNGLYIDPLNPYGYTSLVATEGENITVYMATYLENTQISNATVKVQVVTPINTTNYIATQSNGVYEVSFNLPILNASYEALLVINAQYGSANGTAVIPVIAQLNYTEFENQIESKIISLSQNVSNLDNEVSKLTTELSSLGNETASLEKTVNTLSKSATILSGEMSLLDSQLTELNHKLNQLTPLVYGALIAAIIGIVFAVISLINIRRALS